VVNAECAGRGKNDLYKAFLMDFLPSFETDLSIKEPTLPRDIPPWLKVSSFHENLGYYMTQQEMRERIVKAAMAPKSEKEQYGMLAGWIFDYLDAGRYASKNKVPYTFLKYIMSVDNR